MNSLTQESGGPTVISRTLLPPESTEVLNSDTSLVSRKKVWNFMEKG